MAKESLFTGKSLQAGNFFSTRQCILSADTYYVGMLLEETDGVFSALSTGALAGIYNGTDGRVLSAQGEDNIVVAGEVAHSALVTDANVRLVLTDALIADYRASGFYIKEV